MWTFIPRLWASLMKSSVESTPWRSKDTSWSMMFLMSLAARVSRFTSGMNLDQSQIPLKLGSASGLQAARARESAKMLMMNRFISGVF